MEVYPITHRKSPDKRKFSNYKDTFRAGEVEKRISKEDETGTHNSSARVLRVRLLRWTDGSWFSYVQNLHLIFPKSLLTEKSHISFDHEF